MSEQIIHILVVEDEETHAELIHRAFASHANRFHLTMVGSLAEARASLAAFSNNGHQTDLVIANFLLPDGQGIELLSTAAEGDPFPLVIMTNQGNEQVAVETIKAGVLDYVVKSPASLAAMPRIAKRALREWGYIVEQRRAEEEKNRLLEQLSQQEARMRAIVNTAPDGIVTVDEQGVVESLNPAAERIFGYQAHEVIGRTVALLIPRLYAEEYGRYIMDKYLDTTQTNGMAKDGELVGFRKDKTTFPLDLALSEVYLGGRRIFTSIIRDLTERKLLEEQLRQAQKMEAVGRLAGGIAHDFNNILTIITGNCQLILKNLSSNDPLYKDIEQINRAGERAASLTRQLLAFSRKQILQPKVLNLNAVITNLERMLRPLINEDIELCAILEPDLGQVEADPGQIEQVIMNLILNARDAMPHGGTLTIETAAVYLDQAYTRQHIGVKAGRYIMLAISDTGLGMDAEVKDHIFEPFFTTKEQSKGTGLGLATVYGIVNQSGGHIWVYSEPDKGTTFKIYLPRVDKPVEAITSPPTLSTQAQGMETILRVEDGFI